MKEKIILRYAIPLILIIIFSFIFLPKLFKVGYLEFQNFIYKTPILRGNPSVATRYSKFKIEGDSIVSAIERYKKVNNQYPQINTNYWFDSIKPFLTTIIIEPEIVRLYKEEFRYNSNKKNNFILYHIGINKIDEYGEGDDLIIKDSH